MRTGDDLDVVVRDAGSFSGLKRIGEHIDVLCPAGVRRDGADSVYSYVGAKRGDVLVVADTKHPRRGFANVVLIGSVRVGPRDPAHP